MSTIVSAPGKVLLTGGYLVLDPDYSGLVVGTSARFYTAVSSGTTPDVVTVRSPQFDAAQWSYSIIKKNDKGHVDIVATTNNPFVEAALRYTLWVIEQRMASGSMFWDRLASGLEIVIVGDNDFYSQRDQLASRHLPYTAETLQSIEPFAHLHTTLKDVNKTGLGSSAAMTTSLVASLCLHFGVADLDTDSGRGLIHNLTQFVHCFAQGKVGSGFDVSAAVWGSHRYHRFRPDILTPLMDGQADAALLCATIGRQDAWDNVVVPFRLPPGIDLVLADISIGSHTPTLVSQVLAWRKAHPEQADTLWKSLNEYNRRVENHLRALTSQHDKNPTGYCQALDDCAQHSTEKLLSMVEASPVAEQVASLANDFRKVRAFLREMSTATKTPIEPPEQTLLLDACMQVPGVVLAGVPGAGGYDAIACLVLSPQAKKDIQAVWSKWTDCFVGPLLTSADDQGARKVTDVSSIPGLTTALSL